MSSFLYQGLGDLLRNFVCMLVNSLITFHNNKPVQNLSIISHSHKTQILAYRTVKKLWECPHYAKPILLKKGYRFSRLQPALTKLSWPGINKVFPARESLVSDIPAGDGKNYNLFFQCKYVQCARWASMKKVEKTGARRKPKKRQPGRCSDTSKNVDMTDV